MRKTIKKAKKVRDIAKGHIKPISIISTIVIALLISIFWNDIINFLVRLWKNYMTEWYSIPLALLTYKIFIAAIVNLTKRFAINKSIERFKKSIIYSEMDELLLIFISLKYNELKKIKLFLYVSRAISIVISSIVSWVLLKTGYIGVLIGNLFNSQFWTLLFTWIMNIPGFITIVGLAIWLWLEAKVPWIPRFYNWLYSIIRNIFGKYWECLESIGNFILDDIYLFERKYIHPVGEYMDDKEIDFIKVLKIHLYKKVGRRNYRRYRKMILTHNNKQIANKLEKERKARVFRFGLLRKRAKMLKELREKTLKKEE